MDKASAFTIDAHGSILNAGQFGFRIIQSSDKFGFRLIRSSNKFGHSAMYHNFGHSAIMHDHK